MMNIAPQENLVIFESTLGEIEIANKYMENEARGQELMRQLKHAWATSYQEHGASIVIPSKIFPIRYLVMDGRILINDRKEDGYICVNIMGIDMPTSDRVLSIGLLLEYDEVNVIKTGLWHGHNSRPQSGWSYLCDMYQTICYHGGHAPDTPQL